MKLTAEMFIALAPDAVTYLKVISKAKKAEKKIDLTFFVFFC